MRNTTKKINVGIDAKWFFNGPPSGNMVVKNLVNEIVKNNKGRYNLFLLVTSQYRKQARKHFPEGTNLIFLPNIPNLLSNSFLVPLAALKYNIKVMLFQNFISTWPHKLYKIAYIHDVLFLDYPEYYTRPELLYFKRMKGLAAKADKIITISDAEKKRLIANDFAAAAKISVVYHGISDGFKPVARFAPGVVGDVVRKYDLPARYLLFVGRVNIRKNLINLVKALKFLDDKAIKLLIVGEEKNLYNDLRNYIHTEKLTNRIVFTGHVPEDDLHVIYACATIFCFPSYAEGFGMPPLEAMKCGVPVVVSDSTAMPEICGDAAVYVAPDNVNDIACKINWLLNDEQLYKETQLKGLRHAQQFVWAKSAKQILTLIDEAYVN